MKRQEATMSDEGEKTCPLCAEEMDLTDQQLRPCKRGFDICIWCEHYIMDMAEKDDTEGRCPAYCTPYNKEKIAGTASKCERLVAEMSMEKKQKSQKGKTMLNAWVLDFKLTMAYQYKADHPKNTKCLEF